MIQTLYQHIEYKEGIAYVEGKTTKVSEIIVEHQAYGWSAEEIHFQHPYLSLSEIYSALAYYWDNKEAMNIQIEKEMQNIENLKNQYQSSVIKKINF